MTEVAAPTALDEESTIDFSKEPPPSYKIKMPDGTVYECDPITVSIEFERSGVAGPEGNSAGGSEAMVQTIRKVFHAPALTDAQAIMVMNHFKNYMERLQKKIASTPTSSIPTAPLAGNIPLHSVPPSGSKSPDFRR
jgi:hypothetical protein